MDRVNSSQYQNNFCETKKKNIKNIITYEYIYLIFEDCDMISIKANIVNRNTPFNITCPKLTYVYLYIIFPEYISS